MCKVKFRCPGIGDGRFKSWQKIVESVDTSKTNGFAFVGDCFLRCGELYEFPTGTYIIVYGEDGSRAHHYPCVALYRVVDGTDYKLERLGTWECLGLNWALEIRDEVSAIIGEEVPPDDPLKECDTDMLLGELSRRGITVTSDVGDGVTV
jgi:hypothetical protein